MPVRKIPIQTRSKSGYFYSRKNRRSIAYESLLEKKCFLALEFDDEVVSYEEQPLKIKNYIPDVLARTKNGRYLLIEVKYSKESENPDERLLAKFDTLKRYCSEKGWIFKIFTEKEIKEPYFSNLSFLYRYANLDSDDGILRYVKEKKEIHLRDLIDGGFDAAHVYALLAKGKLKTDLDEELSPKSRIRINDA